MIVIDQKWLTYVPLIRVYGLVSGVTLSKSMERKENCCKYTNIVRYNKLDKITFNEENKRKKNVK